MKTTLSGALVQRGIALAETLLSMAVLAIAANTVVSQISLQFDRHSIERAKDDIVQIESTIEKYRAIHHRLPDSLTQLGTRVPTDPWGRAYEYVTSYRGGFAEQRTFDGLPINSEYDLYSRGSDGRTDPNLRTDTARDDIVRARDGAFVGPAIDF